jgi:alpha-tubulin suppressor-like RCC1 family protein
MNYTGRLWHARVAVVLLALISAVLFVLLVSDVQSASAQTTPNPIARAWGINSFGQLGDDSVAPRSRQVPVKSEDGLGSLGNVTSMDGGQNHTLALKNGNVYAWGHNGSGQLGYDPDPTTPSTNEDSDRPGQVSGLTEVLAVAAGSNHSLAIKSDGTEEDGVANDGTVWAWGDNFRGQLGYDPDPGTPGSQNSSTPGQVSGLTDVVAIAGGGSHSLAVKSNGTVWAWGYDGFGQLGDTASHTNDQSMTPVQVQGVGGSGFLTGVSSVAGGGLHSLALKSDGTVYAWGYNGSGGLGNGGGPDSSTPVQVKGENSVGFLTSATDVAAGGEHSLAIKDGNVYAWGLNNFRQLGDDTTVFQRNAPVKVKGEGGVGFLTGATDVAAGAHHSLAANTNGTVWAWGRNDFGSLGDGTFTSPRATPVQSVQLFGATQIASGDFHSLAVADADTTAPTTTATSLPPPNAAGWNNSNVNVTLSATDTGGSGVKQISYSASGAQTIPSSIEPDDSASVPITAEGQTTISFSARDIAANTESPPKSFTVKLDKTVPQTFIDASSPSGPINDNKPTFDFSGSDNLTASGDLVYSHKVVADGVDPESVAWSDFSAATSATLGGAEGLDDGSYIFYVRARDLADNVHATPTEQSFVVDTTTPAAPLINSPAEGTRINTGSFAISGTAEVGSTVELFEVAPTTGARTPKGTPTTAGTDGNWSISLSGVAEGNHTYVAKSTDAAGNASAESNARTVIVDTTAPLVTGKSPKPNSTGISPNANVIVTFSEAMMQSSLTRTTVKLVRAGTTRAVGASLSYPSPNKVVLNPTNPLVRGATYRVTIVGGTSGAKDLAGNALAANVSWRFKVRA